MTTNSTPTCPTATRSILGILSLTLALVVLATPALAQGVPSDAIFRDFEPTGDMLMEVDGQPIDGLELYFSGPSGAYLAMAPSLASPVLISTRTGTVEKVNLMKVRKQDDGTLDLAADAAFDIMGRFSIDGLEVRFDLEGQSAVLKPKPPLLGFQEPAALREYKAEYDQRAEQYRPTPAAVETLRNLGDNVEVVVYFGTWCPTCGRLVPNMLRVDQELDGAGPRFRYYGLPRDMSTDAEARRNEIHGVPTALVLVDGKEKARFGVRELNNPEISLRDLLR